MSTTPQNINSTKLLHIFQMRRIFLCITASLILISTALAGNPTATNFSWDDCMGTAKPYPAPTHIASYPDSLTPVMINHIGRHGSRFPSSPKKINALIGALDRANATGSITPLGKNLLQLCKQVLASVNGCWGALDSLGMAEQRGIASRMIAAYPSLFKNAQINATSSYAPRCIMSMDEFTHQLARMDNSVELNLFSGRRFSPLLRFFDNNPEYREFRSSETFKTTIDSYINARCPTTPIIKVLGSKFSFDDYPVTATELALCEYSVLSGLKAMGLSTNVSNYLTSDEQNALWGITNLQHYFGFSASTLSSTPASMAAPLLNDLISTTDSFISNSSASPSVNLRFAHAETLIPLLSLMKTPGCYYLTNIFETVASHWQDFNIAPMSANLQIILFSSPSGNYYIRTDLNETPTPLLPNSDKLYTPWDEARKHLLNALPLY